MSYLPLTPMRAATAALLLALQACTSLAQAPFTPPPPAAVPAPPPEVEVPSSLEAELKQRAEAQFALGDVAGALSTYGVLETALTGGARSNNRDALWQALNTLPPGTDFSNVTEPIARGWVELMRLAQAGAPLADFERWRQQYPGHPGESQIAAGLVTSSSVPATHARNRQIALLLPLSDALAAASKVIQSGAVAAQQRAGADAATLVVLDTSPSLAAAFASLEAQQASALVGPLRKEEVATLTTRPMPVPTIALNYLDDRLIPPAGLTPFGLAPEDEARAAAIHATGGGLLRAVILAQEGDWGQRAADAFRAQFEQRGGVVLAAESYKANTVNFTSQLKRLLGITYSEARGSELAAAGVKAEMQPVPRGDIDVVFLASRAPQAKLIWPQMRYLRAGRIATYATAAASDAGNADLGGLMVCDAPWRIETRGEMAALRGELASVNPRTADAQRLFALGYDAYELARRVMSSALVPNEQIPGLSGALVLEADGAVHRRLDCTSLYAPRIGDFPDDLSP
jgi:uncharacterized protein